MPEICRFYGIIIKMFFGDHNPPHFHAEYGGQTAVFDIQTLGILRGDLPPHAVALVTEWATIHRNELLDAWKNAVSMEPVAKIAPLE